MLLPCTWICQGFYLGVRMCQWQILGPSGTLQPPAGTSQLQHFAIFHVSLFLRIYVILLNLVVDVGFLCFCNVHGCVRASAKALRCADLVTDGYSYSSLVSSRGCKRVYLASQVVVEGVCIARVRQTGHTAAAR